MRDQFVLSRDCQKREVPVRSSSSSNQLSTKRTREREAMDNRKTEYLSEKYHTNEIDSNARLITKHARKCHEKKEKNAVLNAAALQTIAADLCV